jgi:hypothetical protein
LRVKDRAWRTCGTARRGYWGGRRPGCPLPVTETQRKPGAPPAPNLDNCCHAVRDNVWLGSIPNKRLAEPDVLGPYCGAKLRYNVIAIVVTGSLMKKGDAQPEMRPCQRELVHSSIKIALLNLINGSVNWRTLKKGKKVSLSLSHSLTLSLSTCALNLLLLQRSLLQTMTLIRLKKLVVSLRFTKSP